MNRLLWTNLFAALALTLAAAGLCVAQATSDAPAATSTESVVTPTRAAQADVPPAIPDAEKSKDVITALPQIVINRKEKTVAVEGFICQKDAMLELFACGNRTREHEAVVSLKARPLHVNTALILLGATPGHPATWTKDGKFLPPYGPVFRVFVEYMQDGKPVRVEAHEMLMNAATGKPAEPLKFVFCGGLTRGHHFLPDIEGTVVCLSNFPAPILDVPFESTAKNSELLFKCRPETIAAPGTPVKLILLWTGETIEGRKLDWVITVEADGALGLEGKPSSMEGIETRLKDRDEYLERVLILVHPKAPAGKLLEAMNLVTKYGLEVQVQPLVAVESPGGGAAPAPVPAPAPDRGADRAAPKPEETK